MVILLKDFALPRKDLYHIGIDQDIGRLLLFIMVMVLVTGIVVLQHKEFIQHIMIKTLGMVCFICTLNHQFLIVDIRIHSLLFEEEIIYRVVD